MHAYWNDVPIRAFKGNPVHEGQRQEDGWVLASRRLTLRSAHSALVIR